MKTKAILSLAVAVAMVSTIFAGMALAGESDSIVGTTQVAAQSDLASLEAWNTLRPNEIVTDRVGVTGLSGTSEMWMYDAGNYRTNWATNDVSRHVIARTIGGVGWATSVDLTLISGSGFQAVTSPNIAQMVSPSGAYYSGNNTVHLEWTAPPDAARIAGYLVYRGTVNGTWSLLAGSGAVNAAVAGYWWSNTCTMERATSWTSAYFYNDNTVVSGTNYYYALRYVYTGTAGNGVPTNSHGSTGLNNPQGTFVPVISAGSAQIITLVAAGLAPTTYNVVGLPNPHNGNTVAKFVNITATTSDVNDTAPDNINGARFRIDGGAWVAMSPVDGLFNSITEAVYGLYNFPNPVALTEGAHTIEVTGSDVSDGYNVSMRWGNFTLDDTTAPIGAYSGASPPDWANRSIGSPVTIYATYTDHFNYSVATLWYWNGSEAFHAHSVAMSWVSTAYSCYVVGLSGTFVVYGAATGGNNIINYEVTLTDSAVPPNSITIALRHIYPFNAASQPQDPYPIFGFTYQYNGVAGGAYTPTLIAGCTVTVAWQNTSIAGSPYTTSFATVLGSQYSKSILNYTEGTIVYTNVTVNPVYAGSLGYNYTTIETLTFPGGRVSNITCGVPYNVLIMQPIIGANLIIASPFAIEYQIVDRNGVRAPGYYTLNLAVGGLDGPLDVVAGHMINPVYGYTNPLGDPKTFNGLADPDPGHYLSATMALNFPPGVWWINATEGGITEADLYLTPWDVWYVDPLNTLNGWLKDYDNITVNVAGGGFDWRLTTGWNLVSCPQAGTYRAIPGVNPYFDAQDALNWTNLYMFATYGVYDRGLSMANRTGGNPSAYASYDLDTGEAAAFGIDYRIGYWVFVSIATAGFPGGNAIIHFDSVNATENAGVNLVTYDLAAGWNLMGFQHNFTGVAWCAGLTASDYTDGTVSAPLNIAGALTKIVLTQWPAVAQKWYIDYVVTDWFPGMAPLNWVWDGTYSPNPGNGFWIWVNAATTYTYNPTVVL